MTVQTRSASPARRLGGRSWRDPRLLIGVLLVLGATVLGARAFAAQDDTTAYWAVREDVRAGSTASPDQLERVRVRLGDDTAQRYVDATTTPDLAGRIWSRDLAAGALVEPAAWTAPAPADSHELPLRVDAGAFPRDLARGDAVDVWAGPAPGEPAEEDAERVLSGVRVVSAGSDDPVGEPGRTVVVAVERDQLVPRTMSAVSARHVTLVRVP